MRNIVGDKIRKIFSGSNVRRYEIGGKTYVQRPLVLGQIRQLLDLLRGTVVPVDAGAVGVILALGDKISAALAIVLTEEGAAIEDKDLDALAKGFEFAVTPELALEVFEDFLACNPLSSLLERLAGMMGSIQGMLAGRTTGSLSSASSLAPGTSPSGTPSSGV